MTTDCIHCGQNPGEVCRGCHERTRQEAYAWADERLDVEYASRQALIVQNGDLCERAVLAEQECGQLRAQLARLREAARAIINVCPSHIARTDIIDDSAVYALTLGELRALAKALEEASNPTPPPSA